MKDVPKMKSPPPEIKFSQKVVRYLEFESLDELNEWKRGKEIICIESFNQDKHHDYGTALVFSTSVLIMRVWYYEIQFKAGK